MSLAGATLTIQAAAAAAPSQPSSSIAAPVSSSTLKSPSGGLEGRYVPYHHSSFLLLPIRLSIQSSYCRIKNAQGVDTVLGTGSFGKVLLMKDTKSNNALVAVKLLIRNNDSEANNALREAFKVQNLRHSNIVELLDAFIVSQPRLQVCTVLEYCKDGDLEAYLGKAKDPTSKISSKVRSSFCLGSGSGFAWFLW